MKAITVLTYALVVFFCLPTQAQTEDNWGFERKHFIGTQAFMIFTPLLDRSPEFYQLSYGYRPTAKDEISIEAITWVYRGPGGRPHGPDFENPASDFPGDVKAFGVGFAYKRFLWKGAFGQIHSTAFRQIYRDERKQKIQSGFQLFNSLRFGYHFKVLKRRWFVSPSVAFTYWPVNTNLPASFQLEEDKWANYFLFEPGLHVGFVF
ncbi:hypothetical protein [Neolewinella persica]|uniref:hypothetical protein n=1 Tax=Neolewinella persica TaxID=70998 RepID=UPI0008FBF32F|nr:hypothetical protein [Neolewinella persica]